MPGNIYETRDATVQALQVALQKLSRAVPAPETVWTLGGRPAYRYVEETPQQAIVLKCVRLFSALVACDVCLDAGLPLDVGAIMRVMDEIGSDIMFLAGPAIFQRPPEERHKQFLIEFFQEEFDHADPLKATQKRARVSRKDIRAYVARTFTAPGVAVSDVVTVTETIDNAFSGYVHGAAGHVMDTYDGRQFQVPVGRGERPRIVLADQYAQYLHRALMSFEVAASALGLEELRSDLHSLAIQLFDPYGDIR